MIPVKSGSPEMTVPIPAGASREMWFQVLKEAVSKGALKKE